MVDEKVRLIMGSLLHDTGKVIYRQGDDRRNHSISGYDYLKEETNLTDSEILDCVRYHHASLLKRAVGLKENSLAYIVYLADNIAAFSDRRKKDESEDRGFERSLPLQSVFNILNGNHQEKYYHPGNMDPKNGINDPGDEKIPFSESFYTTVKVQITENLKGMDWNIVCAAPTACQYGCCTKKRPSSQNRKMLRQRRGRNHCSRGTTLLDAWCVLSSAQSCLSPLTVGFRPRLLE